MPQPDCFVLDLDDTLYPECDYVRSGFSAVDSFAAASRGIEGFGAACWQGFLRGERGRIFDTALQSHYGVTDAELVSELVRVYRSHRPLIALFEDARRFLDRVRNTGLPLALITDGPPRSQRAKIEALGLGDTFAPLVVTAELGTGKSKPHPAAFELVQRTVGAELRFAYIADNPRKDFLAPNRLGWTSVRIQRPGGIYSQAVGPALYHAPQHTVTLLDDVWEACGW